jgi:integrase/recombinase XerD
MPTNTMEDYYYPSNDLYEAFTDFMLSRQAMYCSPRTLAWYKFTLGKVMEWFGENGITCPGDIHTFHIRSFLAELVMRGLSDSYINGYARAIRTLLRFFFVEEYMSVPVTFPMPLIARKRLLVLSADDVNKLLAACRTPRDKALIMLMVDTGLRRGELCNLNWGDVDIAGGLVRVEKGKGGKARSVVIGIATRRTLLKYRRTPLPKMDQPLFQTRAGDRLSYNGLRSILLRVGKLAGIKVTPHALRRTFATLSLRAGMNLLHLQGLLGHSTLEMTRSYVQMVDEDLVEAHKLHGPMDNILHLPGR